MKMRNLSVVIYAILTLLLSASGAALQSATRTETTPGKPIVKTLFVCADMATAQQALSNTPRDKSYSELKTAITVSARSLGCKRARQKWDIVSISTAYRRAWENDVVNGRLVQWLVAKGRVKNKKEIVLIVEFSEMKTRPSP